MILFLLVKIVGLIPMRRSIHPTFNLIKINLELNDSEQDNRHYKLPFFQRDNFGLVINRNQNKLIVSTEMSVTQLSDLALCSRYFYLKTHREAK